MRRVREWTRSHLAHEDAPLIATELFTAILGSGPDRHPDIVEMTISTAGPRVRISATGYHPLPVLQTHGPGALIIRGLSQASGTSDDLHSLWAQLTMEAQ
ncbi:hypothetical protein ACWEFL_15665 [Streptomyces sp. NPDC004838]